MQLIVIENDNRLYHNININENQKLKILNTKWNIKVMQITSNVINNANYISCKSFSNHDFLNLALSTSR